MKRKYLIILIIIFIILFAVCNLSFQTTSETREKKIISYLENKYHSKFEIVELKYSGENMLIEGISIDGSRLLPTIRDKKSHYYIYNIHSISEDKNFDVEYNDGRFIDNITERSTYFSIKNQEDFEMETDKYIIEVLGNNNMVKENSIVFTNSFKIEEDFDEICDSDYIKKLEKIADFVYNKNMLDKDIFIYVSLKYYNNVEIIIGYEKKNNLTINKIYTEYVDGADRVDDKYYKTYYSLTEYLNR